MHDKDIEAREKMILGQPATMNVSHAVGKRVERKRSKQDTNKIRTHTEVSNETDEDLAIMDLPSLKNQA
jgi:hypothetical protein